MDPEVAEKLLAINRRFYTDLAQPFAGSRNPRQPGLQRVVQSLAGSRFVLDVGCGNGRLAHAIDEAGYTTGYLGIDASPELVEIAIRSAGSLVNVQARFAKIDITEQGWVSQLPRSGFDAIALLAVLHHIPSADFRKALLCRLHSLLSGDGLLLVSAWQFLRSERLRRKIVPWSAVGLSGEAVEPGDYLLDWHRGGSGLRYCRQIDLNELQALAETAGFEVSDSFYADGSGQDLSLFVSLRKGTGSSSEDCLF